MVKVKKDSELPYTVGTYDWLLQCEIQHGKEQKAKELRGYLREAKFTLLRAERLGHLRDYPKRLEHYQSIATSIIVISKFIVGLSS
ncbi:hypothetical protein DAH37_28560 [Escherichia coli]|uniref:hypothetical protein n=1 Tax=Escherichia coli TaxID=562 RepID=UPI001100EBB6|nr:hypothetical protein [Escherichia coli]QJT71306.1 hypothetical protein GR28A_00018 [Vibrio phage vB_VcorM_GR28A]TGF51918.1 hypothetical protein DAH37_28560 [Escherichia coli]